VKVFVDARTKVAAEARAPVVDSVRAGQARPSIGHAFGLHDVEDPLSLESAVALVLDQRSGEVLFEKNSRAVLPIASISKLMTAIVVLDAKLPLDEMLEISEADVDTERFTRSRLRTGTRLTRDELLHLALMSSENRAAHALGRHYPGGMPAFVAQMNHKAQELGMTSSGFVEPTGLSSSNVSSARDLALLVQAASRYPLIREYSTASALSVDTGRRTESYRNTNRLVDRSDWEIGVQKTGFISEAGNCVVMQARIASRPVVMVLLDAEQRAARVSDSLRIRQWVEGLGAGGVRRVAHPDGEAEQPAREPGAHNV
jgi:D-alanyl-D-alanine endopeptidase (penicillin-binding protein 7)